MYSSVAANKRNTILIMALFVGLVTAVGWAISYVNGQGSTLLPWILGGALLYSVIQYYAAASLAVAMTGAREIKKVDNPRLYRIVENLSITYGMPMPKVYVVDDPAPNAFATGRDPKHAVVAATTGLMDILSDRELNGVMAHEMAHVKNYDIRVSMIAFGLVSVVGILSDIAFRMMLFGDNRNNNSSPIVLIVGIVVLILAPIIAAIIQLAISRQREYLADATGALTIRDAEGLASALEKLESKGRPMQKQSTSTAHLFFSNPLKHGGFAGLFSTHPALEKRVQRLRDNQAKF